MYPRQIAAPPQKKRAGREQIGSSGVEDVEIRNSNEGETDKSDPEFPSELEEDSWCSLFLCFFCRSVVGERFIDFAFSAKVRVIPQAVVTVTIIIPTGMIRVRVKTNSV